MSNNVYQEAIKRIEWLYDNFKTVIVSHSGGKDSTVVYHLALEVAKAKNRLPLKVVYLDQETEWESTIDVIKEVMYSSDVEPHWLQFPFKLSNSTSPSEEWLMAWDENAKDKWMRDKDPISIKENTLGTDRFAEVIMQYGAQNFGDSVAYIGGVRAEESPARMMGLTQGETYKGETWGKVINKKRDIYTFYPIYDWRYIDVWKYIQDNGFTYSKLYDYQYRYGVGVTDMRLSSLIHETALKALHYMQEVEPDTWERLTNRIDGINTEAKMSDDALVPKELPFMFDSWIEYRDYLLDNIILDEKNHTYMQKTFREADKLHSDPYFYMVEKNLERAVLTYIKTCIKTILRNDVTNTLLGNYDTANRIRGYSNRKPPEENRGNWIVKWELLGRDKGLPMRDPDAIQKLDKKYRIQETI